MTIKAMLEFKAPEFCRHIHPESWFCPLKIITNQTGEHKMKPGEEIKILDEVIPPSHNKMVGRDNMEIAIAWREIKATLSQQIARIEELEDRLNIDANQPGIVSG